MLEFQQAHLRGRTFQEQRSKKKKKKKNYMLAEMTIIRCCPSLDKAIYLSSFIKSQTLSDILNLAAPLSNFRNLITGADCPGPGSETQDWCKKQQEHPCNATGMLKTVFKASIAGRSLALQRRRPVRTFLSLIYNENGQPEDVLGLKDISEGHIGPRQAFIEWLAVSFPGPVCPLSCHL